MHLNKCGEIGNECSQAIANISRISASIRLKRCVDAEPGLTFLQLGGERDRWTALERGAISCDAHVAAGLFVARPMSRLGDLNTMGIAIRTSISAANET